MSSEGQHPTLRFLDAGSVEHPGGTLTDFRICTAANKPLGFIGGVLIDPAVRRVRYLVVDRPALLARRRYMVSVDRVAILDAHAGKIQIEGAEELLERFDPASVPSFSDEDLIATIFATNAA